VTETIYIKLTREFNAGQLRAILAGGQAVVWHRLAIMSKDGDWILREDEQALVHVRDVLSAYHANYRFGAPLDERWLRGGWSAHLEFMHDFWDKRPALKAAPEGRDALEAALDAERREAIRANEERLERYSNAATDWATAWPRIRAQIANLPLAEAHRIVVAEAEGVLPFAPEERV